MNILMLGWEFPPFIKGGLGPATADLSKELAKRGHNITFALPYKLPVSSGDFNIIFAGDKPEYSDELLYRHHYASVEILQSTTLTETEKKIKIKSLLDEVLLYAQRLKKMIKDIDYDIVHAHDWLTMPSGIVAKQDGKKGLVSHIHSSEFYRSGGSTGNKNVFAIEHQGIHSSDKIICISNHVKHVITKHYQASEGKISVVHNGVAWHSWKVDYEQIRRLKERHKKIVLSLGRLTIQKGIDYLLQAAKLVVEKDPDVLFIIVGGGDMQDQLMHFAAEEGLMKNLIFTGWIKQDEASKYYAAADLFVMPSVAEPFGLVAMEAALFDTPVIMSHTSGAADVFKHCLKTDFWDTRMLASHILAVVNYKSLKEEMTKNGKKNVGFVTWEKAAKQVEDIYKQLR